MQLNKDIWLPQDRIEFDYYLQSLTQKQKMKWTKRIINTKMPLLAISTPVLKNVIKQIANGNVVSFLKSEKFAFYENTIIYGSLLTHLKPFSLMSKHLKKLSKVCDNWATCDSIPFKNINKNDKENLFLLGTNYSKYPLAFQRRIGMKIMMEFAGDETKTEQIFSLLNQFENEKHYYVNMMNAWLICELFVKQKQKTFEFLAKNNLNNFTINKAISKCRDSYRVTNKEKKILLNFKK